MVGQYALGIAVCTPPIAFFRLNLRSLLATDARRRFSYRQYLQVTAAATLCAFAIIGTILWIGDFGGDQAVVIASVGLMLSVGSFSDLSCGYYQQKERMDLCAISLAVRHVLGLIVLIFVLWQWRNLNVALSVSALVTILALFATDRLLFSRYVLWQSIDSTKRRTRQRRLHEVLSLSMQALPWGTVTLLLTLNAALPRLFVEHHVGIGDLGLLAAAVTLCTPANTLVTGLVNASLARLSQFHTARRLSRFRSLLRKLIGIVFAIALGTWIVTTLFGNALLTSVYSDSFRVDTLLLSVLMLGAAIQLIGSALGGAVLAMNKSGVALAIHSIGALLVLLTSMWFIPWFGLFGAAVAMSVHAIATTVAFGAYVYVSK